MLRKVWHQLLRRPLTAPSSTLAHDFLKIPRSSLLEGTLTLILSFALSGALHTVAGVASGMPLKELGVFRFFCTQALGVLVEQGAIAALRCLYGRSEGTKYLNYGAKALGYMWVAAFMIWSGPAWIYPQTLRAPPKGAINFLPFSIVGALTKHT